jgi:hypothetical protein
LKVEGVKHVFGIVGSTFLDVLDRLYDDSSVEYNGRRGPPSGLGSIGAVIDAGGYS